MKKSSFKSNISFSDEKIKVDRERGEIKDIVIVQHGANKNETYFNQKFLEDIVQHGNNQKQGVKCRFGHPNMCATTLGTYLGRYLNFKLENNKVLATLKLDPISKKTQVEGKGISMQEYVLDMAENNPDMFGNSIVIMSEIFEEKVGKDTFDSHLLQSFLASDLVDDPAATDSLFSSTNDLGIQVTEFLDQNPQIFNAIEKDPSIMEDFFSRYKNYLKNYKSSNMNFTERFKKLFSKDVFDKDMTLADGSIVTVVTDSEEPQVGDEVKGEDGNLVADGEHLLPDGKALVTEGGKITEIKEAEASEDSEESNSDEAIESLKKDFSSFKKDMEDSLLFLGGKMAEFGVKQETLAKSVKSEYKAPKPDKKDVFEKGGEMTTYEKMKAKLNEKKEG